jgi:hypothetical protein
MQAGILQACRGSTPNSVIFSVRLAFAAAIRTMTRGCCCFIALGATQNEYCSKRCFTAFLTIQVMC